MWRGAAAQFRVARRPPLPRAHLSRCWASLSRRLASACDPWPGRGSGASRRASSSLACSNDSLAVGRSGGARERGARGAGRAWGVRGACVRFLGAAAGVDSAECPRCLPPRPATPTSKGVTPPHAVGGRQQLRHSEAAGRELPIREKGMQISVGITRRRGGVRARSGQPLRGGDVAPGRRERENSARRDQSLGPAASSSRAKLGAGARVRAQPRQTHSGAWPPACSRAELNLWRA